MYPDFADRVPQVDGLPPMWLCGIDPGLKEFGYAFLHTTMQWGPCGVIGAKGLPAWMAQARAVMGGIRKTQVRYVNIMAYESIPIMRNPQVTLDLQATVGVWMGMLLREDQMSPLTKIEKITPASWQKMIGTSTRDPDRKFAAISWATDMHPEAVKQNKAVADAICIVGRAAELVARPL